MEKIKSNREYRLRWQQLLYYQEWLQEHPEEVDCCPITDRVIELKERLRQYAQRDTSGFWLDGFWLHRRFVSDSGMDGYVELITLPDIVQDAEAADEFFRAKLEIAPYYSAYDCTGRPFTNWYKIFCRNGQWMAYHSVGFDF